MSVQIIIPGANFTKSVAKLGMPYLSQADHFFLFGGDDAASIRNRARADAPAGQLVGAPELGANYARFGGADYFRAGANSAGPVTFIACFRYVNGDRGNFGNYDPATSKGLLAYWQSPTQFWGGVNGTQGAHIDGAPGADFCMAAITNDGANSKLYLFNDIGAPLFGNEAKVSPLAAAPFRIGGWAALGAIDAAMAMVLPSVLSQSQLIEIRAYARVLLASRGVTLK